MVHLDYVMEMLPEGSRNVEVKGLLDSALYLEDEPIPASQTALDQTGNRMGTLYPSGLLGEARGVWQQANVTHFGSECAAVYPMQLWKCMFGQYRMPLIKSHRGGRGAAAAARGRAGDRGGGLGHARRAVAAAGSGRRARFVDAHSRRARSAHTSTCAVPTVGTDKVVACHFIKLYFVLSRC